MWMLAWNLKNKHWMHWSAIDSFTPAFSKHFYVTYYVPGTCQGAGVENLMQHSSALDLDNLITLSSVCVWESDKTAISLVVC